VVPGVKTRSAARKKSRHRRSPTAERCYPDHGAATRRRERQLNVAVPNGGFVARVSCTANFRKNQVESVRDNRRLQAIVDGAVSATRQRPDGAPKERT
jgi:hypothetical protein